MESSLSVCSAVVFDENITDPALARTCFFPNVPADEIKDS